MPCPSLSFHTGNRKTRGGMLRSGSQPKHFHQLLSVSFVCGASQQAVSSSSNFLATSGSNSLIADHLRTGPRPQKPQKPQSSFHAAGDAIFWSSRCRSSPDLGKRNALGLASTPTPQITATPQPKGSCSAVPPCSFCSGWPRNLNNRQLSKVKLHVSGVASGFVHLRKGDARKPAPRGHLVILGVNPAQALTDAMAESALGSL